MAKIGGRKMTKRSFLYDPQEYIGKLRKELIYREFKPSVSAAVSTTVMFVLIFLVYSLKIPNPNMVLVAGLVICSALFSYSGGIPAAVIMTGYTMFFFSENNNFITFSGQNAQKLVVSILGIIVNTFFVCALKKRELIASGNVKKLIEQLNTENERLHAISMFDSLTGIGNRLALRRNFNSYCNKKLCVIMIDVDNFKNINDTYGHAVGDESLKAAGKLLIKSFGIEACYRYGGDEFLVIIINPDTDKCLRKMKKILNSPHSLTHEGKPIYVTYSIGYVIDYAADTNGLSDMLVEADSYMYKSKKMGKNTLFGKVY
ncbi:MAG: GGDEF domain-containing protein [Ruminococcaceae bacterium]|nr:GGDEF domain-containing protein [Oscillospiraceae bacterium]